MPLPRRQAYDDDDDTTNAQFAWSASQIGVRLSGATSVEADLYGSSTGDRFLVLLDGAVVSDFVVSSGWDTYTVAADLDAATTYGLVLWKATEDNKQKNAKGAAQFGGYRLPGGGAFLDGAPLRKARKLEFIGDSDTAGWCADGSASTGDSANKFQNSHETWAAQLSDALDAEMQVQAISGIGVLSWPIQQYLPYVLPFATGGDEWDYTQYTPDAVVLLIGPNDPSIALKSAFITAYKELLEQVAAAYAYAATPPKLIHVCGGSINGEDPCGAIQTANDEFNGGGRADGFEGHYVAITDDDWQMLNARGSSYLGCDSHYAPSGHAVLMNDILDQVKAVMDW